MGTSVCHSYACSCIQLGFHDPEDFALVIDQTSGSKFGKSKEPRPGDRSSIILIFSSTGYPGEQRQAREIVSRKHSLTCQIAVAIEIRRRRVPAPGSCQQTHLDARIVIEPLSSFLLLLGCCGRHVHCMRLLLLLPCRLKEVPPAVKGCLKAVPSG
ncbi:hypothetical protein DSECCO2_591970 [anaerobic digester metagenome]